MVRMRRALSSAPTFAITLASLVHAAPSGNPRRGVHSEPSSPHNIVEFDQDYLRAGLADYLLDRSDDGRKKDHTVYLTETYTTVSVSTVSSSCSSGTNRFKFRMFYRSYLCIYAFTPGTDSDSVTESYTSVSSYDVEPIGTVGDDAKETGLSDAASRTTETDGLSPSSISQRSIPLTQSLRLRKQKR